MSNVLKQGDFRPSNLDKLAECPWFRSAPGGSEATARGTQIDLAFRSHFLTNPMTYGPSILSGEDISIVEWAVEQTRQLAGEALVITDKDACKIDIPNFDKPGEVDALVSEKCMHIDVKSGQKHDYRLQQAAYAFGLMDRHFTSHWTAYILYCDLQEIERLTFDYREVNQAIEQAKGEYEAPKDPTVNEYCGWCGNFEQCPTQRQLASSALVLVGDEDKFERVKADPQRLGDFLIGCKAVRDFEERGKEHAKSEMLQGRIGADGWKLTTRRGSEHVDVKDALKELPAHAILATIDTISRGQYELVCALNGLKPNPNFIKQSGSSHYLRQTKPKKLIN